MKDREKLILQDFSEKLLYEWHHDPLGFDDSEWALKQIDAIYQQLYQAYPEEYRLLLAYLHQSLNTLFKFMNHKMRNNHHFNADESRELIELIDNIKELQKALSSLGVEFNITKDYLTTIEICDTFLENSNGSAIPDSMSQIELERYNPIFEIPSRKHGAGIQHIESLRGQFNNDHMDEEINGMVAALKDDLPHAIGKAKNMLESCCKTILDDRNIEIPSNPDLHTLVKKAMVELKQTSDNPIIKQILGNISGVATGLSKLRNNYSDAHGQNINKVQKPSEIEAQLAVDSSIAVTRFLWSLHQKQESN